MTWNGHMYNILLYEYDFMPYNKMGFLVKLKFPFNIISSLITSNQESLY